VCTDCEVGKFAQNTGFCECLADLLNLTLQPACSKVPFCHLLLRCPSRVLVALFPSCCTHGPVYLCALSWLSVSFFHVHLLIVFALVCFASAAPSVSLNLMFQLAALCTECP
jgi:hypothetical protein